MKAGRTNMPTRRGIAVIEFAIVTPLMLFLVAAVVDYTLLMRAAIAVGDAARAGAQYGSLSTTNASNISGIQTAALNAAPDIPGITATAAKVCQCSNGTTVNCSGGTCPSGPVRTYVQVTVKTTVNPLFSYPQLGYTGAVVATATMRAQ
jgi:Flp pilus assembly protein TadG